MKNDRILHSENPFDPFNSACIAERSQMFSLFQDGNQILDNIGYESLNKN